MLDPPVVPIELTVEGPGPVQTLPVGKFFLAGTLRPLALLMTGDSAYQ